MSAAVATMGSTIRERGQHQVLDFNNEFQHATALLEAGSSVFITGKAGTGKSTLLRHFLDTTTKRAVVAAPTGVAALNVGGQTIHRLFSFPATVTAEFPTGDGYFPRRNHKVLRSLETLVIDEVSMVRADLLDAVDAALRRFGPKPGQPFGGVQMVFVGDPYQLPPVVAESEEAHFRSRYSTPFFFSADAFKEFDYQLVELQKVYRQHDDDFVALLNAVRTGDADQDVFDRLNERYDPGFEPPDDEFWVTLTTTNAMADTVNERRLDALPTPLLTHQASSWGEIEDADKAVPDVLHYKVGAQVMLVSNDAADRWVNGSMGVIADSSMRDGQTVVTVDLLDGDRVEVGPHEWELTRPVIADGRLSYDVVGTYRQLPFKPAWAVTIHKSQGKTLERAVVSLGRGTFADGQLYVALSRCTSLPGLVLKSEVKRHHVKVEREVSRFLARSRGEVHDAEGTAFIGVHATGITRVDRIVEIGIVIDRGDGELEEYSTLVNPLRDIGRSVDHFGVVASDLEMAPTFAEAWPWLARRIDGCVIVAHGLPLLQTMMEREAETTGIRVDLGLGVDTNELDRAPLAQAAAHAGLTMRSTPTALDLARATRAVFESHTGVVPAATSPYRAGQEAQTAGRIHSRDTVTGARRGEGALAYADAVAHTLASKSPAETVAEELAALADELDVPAEVVSTVHVDALEALLSAAGRDSVTSPAERAAIQRAAQALGLPEPDLDSGPARDGIATVLVPGARVCFTGTATDLSGAPIDRPELHVIAESLGLVPVTSVTQKKCEALVAADATSMSGKAKKARDFGKPVYSVRDFLEWAQGR